MVLRKLFNYRTSTARSNTLYTCTMYFIYLGYNERLKRLDLLPLSFTEDAHFLYRRININNSINIHHYAPFTRDNTVYSRNISDASSL